MVSADFSAITARWDTIAPTLGGHYPQFGEWQVRQFLQNSIFTVAAPGPRRYDNQNQLTKRSHELLPFILVRICCGGPFGHQRPTARRHAPARVDGEQRRAAGL